MRRCFASFNRRCCMIPHQARRGDDTEHELYGSPLENVTNQVGEPKLITMGMHLNNLIYCNIKSILKEFYHCRRQLILVTKLQLLVRAGVAETSMQGIGQLHA